MECNTFQHQHQTNVESLHAQEFTHITDIAYHLSRFKKKKKKKKIDLPTLLFFKPKGQTNLLFFRPNGENGGRKWKTIYNLLSPPPPPVREKIGHFQQIFYFPPQKHILPLNGPPKNPGATTAQYNTIVWLPSTREHFFGFNASGHCLVRVRMLHYLLVGSSITITQSHTHTMQQTHMHKAVTGRVEAKKLLSRRRQSEYSDERRQRISCSTRVGSWYRH